MPKSLFKRVAMGIAVGLAVFSGQVVAESAEDWPQKQVRIMVGFSPGGTTDVLARIVAKELTESLGEPVIVENRPGAGSNIATQQVARAKPDGYTLMMMAITSTINQTLYKNINFDVVKDFAPIALVAKIPNVVVANAEQPYNTIEELVNYAKDDPEAVVYASSGSGTSIHLSAELFKQQAGIEMLHIPFSGSGPGMASLLANDTHVMFDNMPSAAPHIKSGKLKALAVTTAERSEAFPDVPTLQESGFPDYSVTSWFGLVAPAGTPEAIVNKLNAEVQKALAKPEVIKQLDGLGASTEDLTPAQFADMIKSETEVWGAVIEKGGISVD